MKRVLLTLVQQEEGQISNHLVHLKIANHIQGFKQINHVHLIHVMLGRHYKQMVHVSVVNKANKHPLTKEPVFKLSVHQSR